MYIYIIYLQRKIFQVLIIFEIYRKYSFEKIFDFFCLYHLYLESDNNSQSYKKYFFFNKFNNIKKIYSEQKLFVF